MNLYVQKDLDLHEEDILVTMIKNVFDEYLISNPHSICHISEEELTYFRNIRMKETELRRIFDELILLIQKKNHDYGDSFSQTYDEFGLQSIYLRLKDKVNRLGIIQLRQAEIEDETIENVLQDIIGYSALTLLELRSKK